MSTNISPTLESLRPSSERKFDWLLRNWMRGFTPPPRISVPQWADDYRKLAKESGSTSGKWRTSTVEIARGPMLAVTEPGVHVITVMVATQLLKTSLLENIFGYFAHLDPCPMLLVQPKEDAAQQFSKERIGPLVKATPVLRKLVGARRRPKRQAISTDKPLSKTRDSDETLLYKSFPGGFLALTGAGSPDNLARRPVRAVLYDEVDKYPVTREGDPIALGDERMATFVNWLSVRACSPTVEDESRIAASWEDGDQRRASVECPHCGHRQFLDFFKHVEWAKDEDGTHRPKTAAIFCECCGVEWSEGERLRSLQTIRWHQTKPFQCCGRLHSPLDAYEKAWRAGEQDPIGKVWDWWEGDRWAVYRAKCPDCGGLVVPNEHASFQASKLYSPWPKDSPPNIAEKWLKAKDDEDKKLVWWNTQLGLPYRPRVGREIAPNALMERREVWGAEVPDGVAVITAGWDTQDDRIEIEFVGWGRGEESWSIRKEVLDGDPSLPDLWERLDASLIRPMLRADGRVFTVAAVCGDSGGHHTQEVYKFCRERRLRKVWAIKGASETSGLRSPIWPSGKHTRRRAQDYKPVIIGTNAAKDQISSRLQIEVPGPGYMHFGSDWTEGDFAQLTGERLVRKQRSGRTFRIWEAKRNVAHEALDRRVYAMAALQGLIMEHRLDLDKEAERVGATPTAYPKVDTPEAKRLATQRQEMGLPVAAPPEPEKPVVRKSRVVKSNYLRRLGR